MTIKHLAAAALAAAALLAGTATGATGASPPPASATPAAAPVPRQITGYAPALHPEGIAWDPTRRAFLVSSVRHGTVSVVRPDGRTTALVSDPRVVSTYGLHVDAVRGRILVAYADLGVAERSEPGTVHRVGGLGVYDLRTGRPLHLVDLTRLSPGQERFAVNDVAVGADGTAYVSDVTGDAIYRVDRRGRASVLVRDAALTDGHGTGVNGLVVHPDGHLLAVNYGDGRLFRVPLRDPGRFTEVALPAPLHGGDGLALRPDGALVAVTNDLANPRGTDAVHVLRSRDRWRSAAAVVSRPWPVRGPSTAAHTPYGVHVLSGRLEIVFGPDGRTADDFVVRRL
ncbi:SMP-30/gluconolactonase/LRE family protein [Streptomyces sp. NRRL S-118]|uniref:SMP-30/gluconolactonase/LRE family protein n=1 Tax=Streptomyces sp. NRRL S-118 TaxID=1463881 RepID=UPI0007C6759B|nr:SMP-30/gluconolactonase/LRE family protein [Streptomyces sp. NRRL S-118]